MTDPDLEAFRALARSSPWRWRSLQLIVEDVGERLEHPRASAHRVRLDLETGVLVLSS